MGDQFVAVSEGRTQGPDDGRHFGLVVDDTDAVLAAAREAGLDARPSGLGGVDVRDPWGNFFQAVDYRDVQFERTPGSSANWGSRGWRSPRRRARRSPSAGWAEGRQTAHRGRARRGLG